MVESERALENPSNKHPIPKHPGTLGCRSCCSTLMDATLIYMRVWVGGWVRVRMRVGVDGWRVKALASTGSDCSRVG